MDGTLAHDAPTDIDQVLADEVQRFYADPLGFAIWAYPWGQARTALADHDGPCPCQRKILTILGDEVRKRGFDGKNPVKPIRIAVSSGHGIGKSALAGMIANWLLSTRPRLQGTVTANTGKQLETKTWARIQAWTKLCITAHWFTINSERFYFKGSKDDWFISAQTCNPDNADAFQGQHAADSTSLYLFDEASSIDDAIWDAADGGLTDGEPIIIAFGNPTQSQGKFYRITHGSERHRWIHIVIDSRDCPLSNKEEIAEWVQFYGEDSDYVRIRVRGLPPAAAEFQYISNDLVHGAKARTVPFASAEPLIVGCDFAWGGADSNCIRFRRGSDARSIPPVKIPGEATRDPNVMTLKLAEILTTEYSGRKPAMLFLDSAGIAGPVARKLRELGHTNVIEINFGAFSPDPKFANMRSYMWGKAKEWLPFASIDASSDLEEDLTAPSYSLNRQTQILLEPKDKISKRIGHSTDDGDALALTFAMPVVVEAPRVDHRDSRIVPDSRDSRGGGGWMH